MKKSALILIISFTVLFISSNNLSAQGIWPPTNGAAINPQNPISSDFVEITLSGEWSNSCIPVGSNAVIAGNNIYFDVIDNPSQFMCLPIISPWSQSRSVGPLSPGNYHLYARLLGNPGIPETFTLMLEFTVTETQIPPGDINEDGSVDFEDYAHLAMQWLQTTCNSPNSWCSGADFGHDGNVDWMDLMVITDNWLAGN